MNFPKHFVKATAAYSTPETPIPNPQFRKSFSLHALPKNAAITVCAPGYYRLYLNGTEITKGDMAPYRANPDHYLYYDRYDITDLLSAGENAVGILLGNGFLNSMHPTWEFDKAPFRDAPKLALSLEVDGEALFDARGLKCTESPLVFEEFHMGETWDARLETDGWMQTGFDDGAWRNPLPANAPKGEARIPDCEPIKVLKRRRPIKIIKGEHGYLYDFGVNSAGVCELNVKGERGQTITMLHGELIRNGKLDWGNLVNLPSYTAKTQQNTYILKGGAPETYTPHFSYQGFRFVEVTGITDEQATPELLTFCEMSSAFAQTGDFWCDNHDLNAVFDAAIRSDRSNFFYFPTDCPHREKNGWTGDAAISAEQMLIYFDCARSLKEWLRNLFKAQKENGAVPGIVPTDAWGYGWAAGPAWDNVMFELPYRIYQYTGDLEFVRESAPYLLKYLHYMESRRDEAGLLHYGLGDWCHVNYPSSAVTAYVPYTDTITCKNICDKAAFLFDLIGERDSAAYARHLSGEIRAAYLAKYSTSKNQSFTAMCLYYGITKPENLASDFERLKSHIHAHGDHMDCGVLGERALFRVLGEHNESELAVKMITNPTHPSFKYNLEKGMTALAETFRYFEHRIDGLTDEDGEILSLNHHFWGDVIAFFMRHLAGIQVDAHDRVRIVPDTVSTVNNLRAHVTLPAGRVAVSYQKCDVMLEMTVTAPQNVTVTVTPPQGYRLCHGSMECREGENQLTFCKI